MRSVLRSAAMVAAVSFPFSALHAQTATVPTAPPVTPLSTPTPNAATQPPAAPTVSAPISTGRTALMPAVAMREMKPAEERAHQVWSLRAALNVAALQCQFSPYLRTVKNYNLILPHHSAELASALKAITAHFQRHDGPKASRQTFDQYTTRTYNSFSTLEAQLTFCQKASEIGWEALASRKGSLGDIAAARLAEIRDSLIPTVNPLLIPQLNWAYVPTIVNPCLDRKGRMKKKCE